MFAGFGLVVLPITTGETMRLVYQCVYMYIMCGKFGSYIVVCAVILLVCRRHVARPPQPTHITSTYYCIMNSNKHNLHNVSLCKHFVSRYVWLMQVNCSSHSTIIQFVRSNAHIINDPTWLRWNVHDDGWAAYWGIQWIVKYKELLKGWQEVKGWFLNLSPSKLYTWYIIKEKKNWKWEKHHLEKRYCLKYRIARELQAWPTFQTRRPLKYSCCAYVCERCRYRRHCIYDVRCDCFVNVKASHIQSHELFSPAHCDLSVPKP